MLCKKPYIKTPVGVRRLHTVLSEGARLAATPFGCGQCLHCRLNKARVWTLRIMLEQYGHSECCFLTLTYDDKHIPLYGDVEKEDLQKFLKKLRRRVEPKKFRFYAVGEYGDISWRPHYHVVLFGLGPGDCHSIDKVWTEGLYHIGELNKDSARYITGYVVKKLTREGHYELKGLKPEFMTCSKQKGGIGTAGLKVIIEKLNSSPWPGQEVYKELLLGKKKFPLGRYLMKELNRGVSTDSNAIANSHYDYQETIFDNFLLDDGSTIFDNMLFDSAGARKSQEKKAKLHKKRKIL